MASVINATETLQGPSQFEASERVLIEDILDHVMYAGRGGSPTAQSVHNSSKTYQVVIGDTTDTLYIMHDGPSIPSSLFARAGCSPPKAGKDTSSNDIASSGSDCHPGCAQYSLPPLPINTFMLVRNEQEQYIARTVVSQNTDGSKSVSWAYLPVPANFVYSSTMDKEGGIGAMAQLMRKTPLKHMAVFRKGAEAMRIGAKSINESLVTLLGILQGLGEGTGTVYVIDIRCKGSGRLVPATINGVPDLVLDHEDPANRASLSQHLSEVYLLHRLFRGLREAVWEEQNPGSAFEEVSLEIYIQGQTEPLEFHANSFVAAAEASGVVSPVIPILHPSGTLGWVQFAYQDTDAGARIELANSGRSGLYLASQCRFLTTVPSFFSKSESQRRFMSKPQKVYAYRELAEMVRVDRSVWEGVPVEMRPKVPFTLEDATAWSESSGRKCDFKWLGGAGVIGVCVINEAIFNNDKDDLEITKLRLFLDAKYMEQMMAWVYGNPPPDMAFAIAIRAEANDRNIMKKNAKTAAQNERMAKKALKAELSKLKLKRQTNEPAMKDHDKILATTDCTGSRAAGLKADLQIKTTHALEAAPDEEAFGVPMIKDVPTTPRTPAKRLQEELGMQIVVPPSTPDTPGPAAKRPCFATTVKKEPRCSEVDEEWAAFMKEPAKHQSLYARYSAELLFVRKMREVVGGDVPSAKQIKWMDKRYFSNERVLEWAKFKGDTTKQQSGWEFLFVKLVRSIADQTPTVEELKSLDSLFHSLNGMPTGEHFAL